MYRAIIQISIVKEIYEVYCTKVANTSDGLTKNI